LPSATPTSTNPPSRARRNKLWLVGQLVVTAVVLSFVGKALVKQWREFSGQPLTIDANWPVLAASVVVVLLTYAVLIETWRRIVVNWESTRQPTRFGFWTAARIYCISNLGRYVPGKVWQIGAMTGLAQRANISPVAAAGSSILSVIVNIATGFLVALIAGWRSFDALARGYTTVGIVLVVVVLAGVLLLPTALPILLDVARRMTGKKLALGTVPHRAVYLAIVGNVVAWLLYGAAFQLFVRGITGYASGTFANYVTAWAWPYIFGYLAFFAPGGLVVREGALTLSLGVLGLATTQTALVIAVTSRLWLTVTELLPGLTFLALGWKGRGNQSTNGQSSND
jgi:glycosyltransferase 2 family protein